MQQGIIKEKSQILPLVEAGSEPCSRPQANEVGSESLRVSCRDGCCLVKDSKPEKLERHIPDPEKLCDHQCLPVKVSRFGGNFMYCNG